MNAELLRYSCQINLPGFDEAAQQKLKDARVLVVGAGGLGCPSAQYLAAAGIGNLTIADDDVVSIGNLHRQILYTPQEVGLKKAVLATQKLQQQNPQIKITALDKRINSENAFDILRDFDIILDGTDNFDTRYLLNDACVMLNKPLVYGAIYQYEGQVAVWNALNNDGTRTPHYRDVFPEVDAAQIPNCAEGGVIPTLAGIIGCMQANEAIKFITGIGEILAGKIIMFDAQTMQSRVIKIGNVSKVNIQQINKTVTVPIISINDLKETLEKNIYELIDVRTIEERNNFNIGGTHIPVTSLENQLHSLDTTKPIIFYCASGKRSAEAVKMFRKIHPSTEVYSLEGGMKAWMEALY
ncbi:molybdopterin-synthase adenylyltransferase MoeB [Panacibacter ginsenosidivorans]|uniref:Molybdopterin-synthase adenylyltransferase n=1 Tax=Panacibacter ginsenosidivorans TaxID=1813871 RepID=A0A5B8VEW6_9BACT|nr:HesA/MoeB/ThiF family protein [Panacibacter ginsenosidivorans]QEC69980.1 molybdopterin-synthase adenylyltransferase MoeB [Panacibacter ginsenosidivorans]